MHAGGAFAPKGDVKFGIIRAGQRVIEPVPSPLLPSDRPSLRALLSLAWPTADDPPHVVRWKRQNFRRVWSQARRVWYARRVATKAGLVAMYGALGLKHLTKAGDVFDLGLVSLHLVTAAFVNHLTDSLQNQTTAPIDTFDFHGIGTGTTAAQNTDTALETELTTQYQTDNTRATGTPGEGASANIYQSVGTNTVDATVAITEHGLLNNATVGSGVLMDRHVFAAINLTSGDSLQSTYELTSVAET